MPDTIAISVEDVKKDFYLPHEKSSRSIKSSVVNFWRKTEKGGNTQHALKGVSFEIKKGEFFGIVGRNGSGKSTLLKLLAGIYQPTEGAIRTEGKLMPFIELGVGFNPELSGRENVYLNGALLGFSKKEIDTIYDEIVEFAELGDFMDQKLKNYSSGMQVRLAFSVATRAKADIMLIDEVLAVGDADFQRKCYDYFRKIKKDSDVTVIFVTHDMNAVRDFCDRAIVIENGYVKRAGTPDEVADEYLKLFNKSSDAEEVEKSTNRWGSGEVKFEEISLKFDDNKIKLLSSITAMDDVRDFIVDFKIYNVNGHLITGFNTNDLLGLQTIKAGERSDLKFSFDNVFGYRNYTIDAEIVSKDNTRVFDKWKQAASIKDNKSARYKVKYPVNIQVEVL
ncbi:ABC transporter ATP-binding protein [Candidatus Saccharibacteria bacterium TM7i]|nr:ABC transporter ATP-binding protein [Candidatus Saccharibacteria bacterium TM7i]